MLSFPDQVEFDGLGGNGDALFVSIHKLDVDPAELVIFILKNRDLVLIHPIGTFPAIAQRKVTAIRHQRNKADRIDVQMAFYKIINLLTSLYSGIHLVKSIRNNALYLLHGGIVLYNFLVGE